MIENIEIINTFEEKIAMYAGSKYAVSVDSATNAIFLSLLYLKECGILKKDESITIPSHTFLSVPMSIIHAGLKVKFEDVEWIGAYQLKPTKIIDSAVRFKKDMYIKDSLYILSFQYRKSIPIGRGGMILTDSEDAMKWLKMARFNGKHDGVSKFDDKFEICGWDMYMTPEQAARGLALLNPMKQLDGDIGGSKDYPDLSKQEVFK